MSTSQFLPLRTRCLTAALLLVLGLCLAGPLAARYAVETVSSDLEHPWSLVFLPDGQMLVTERAGRLLRLSSDGQNRHEIRGVPESGVRAQGGLMEVALDPEWADNGWVYLTQAVETDSGYATRLLRGRLDGNDWVDNQVLFTARTSHRRPVHYGARLAFLPDGTLLMGIGDGFDEREQAQRLDNHSGTIVRLNRDGSVPTDNPFLERTGALPEIFSYGHRNPQGLVVEAHSGRIWSHEHGPRGGDELNLVRPGANYGWPVVTHGVDYSGAQITPHRSQPGMEDPLIDWTPSIAPAGMSIYQGELFAGWQGNLLVASLVDRSIRRIELDGDAVVSEEKLELDIDRRLRDVRVGPDGALYLLTDHRDGEILRVTPR
ncbi:MAG: PQQ-dependent sugar dehydrogenase [Wenzhouxiangella sp.]